MDSWPHDQACDFVLGRVAEGAANARLDRHEPLIFITPMSTGAAKQLPIPDATGRDVVNADEGRQLHLVSFDVA